MILTSPQGKQRLFDRWAPIYDWVFPSVFYQAVHQRLLDYVTLLAGAQVLDLGCGTGRLLNRLADTIPNLRGTGLDFSAEMVRQARRTNRHHPQLIYLTGTAEALPFGTEQFNAVFCTLSFLHYPHPASVLAEVARVLRSGASFYWVDPTVSQWTLLRQPWLTPMNVRLYCPSERAQLAQQAGLRCLGHHYLLGSILLTVFVKP